MCTTVAGIALNDEKFGMLFTIHIEFGYFEIAMQLFGLLENPTLLAALIGAVAVVAAALIPLIYRHLSRKGQNREKDIEIMKFFSSCLDRPAFLDSSIKEVGVEAFYRAIEDTITAINTGRLRDRKGKDLQISKGKSHLDNQVWRATMDDIVKTLQEIKTEYKKAVNRGDILVHSDGNDHHIIVNPNCKPVMESMRKKVIKIFNGVCSEAGIHPLDFS